VTPPPSLLSHGMPQKQISQQERQRRLEQSKRDKARQQQPAKRRQKQATSGSKPKMLPKLSAAASEGGRVLNRLAMSIATPGEVAPMRLPTVSRQKTAVRHLYDTNSCTFLSQQGATFSSQLGTMFSRSYLPPNSAMFVATRDAVTPGYVSVPVNLTADGQWSWRIYWPDPTQFWGISPVVGGVRSQPIPVVQTALGSMTNETFLVTPPKSVGTIQPYSVKPENNFLVTDDVPAARLNGVMYGYHCLGDLFMNIFLVQAGGASYPLPTGCFVQVRLSLRRFNGVDSLDETNDETALTISQGNDNGYIGWSLPVGYYNIEITSISVQVGSTATLFPPFALQCTVGSLIVASGGGGRGVAIVPVVNSSIREATYLLDNTRVNACSMLLSNRSAALAKAGEVWGMRNASKDGFFGYVTPDIVMSYAGATGTAYYGPLEKGCYTFLEPPAVNDAFHDYSLKYLGATYPIANLATVGTSHIIYASWPADSLTVTSTLLAIKHDIHIEFISNSQLADLGITADPVTEYTKATVVLSAGAYFFENPSHLSQIWKWVLTTGREAVKAGMYAGARHMLTAGLAAL